MVRRSVRAVASGTRVRGFCFTWNNYTDNSERVLTRLRNVTWLLYGKEVAPSTGTPHLQGVIWFKEAKTLKSVEKKLKGAHVAIAMGSPESNRVYCSKSHDVKEFGEMPLGVVARARMGGEANSDRWDCARVAACEGRFADIDSELYIKYQSSFHRIRDLALQAVMLTDNDVLENQWFVGPSGSGKSREARRRYPGAYLKMKNKWWSGYMFEKVVIVDDIDPQHACWIGAFLKEWSDHYPFMAETKGGVMKIRPKCIIVTSQYSIDEVFAALKDPEFALAIKRRFKTVVFGNDVLLNGGAVAAAPDVEVVGDVNWSPPC